MLKREKTFRKTWFCYKANLGENPIIFGMSAVARCRISTLLILLHLKLFYVSAPAIIILGKAVQMNSPKLSYRAEIDGLRAVAVTSVIFYHAQIILSGRDWFEGGYFGVDIFFVISGYLITRIILSELREKGSFSFLNFYERRARRILPMLFVVIFASIPYAWQRLFPLDFVEYAQSILASLLFFSNFFFYHSTTAYGADDALLKPFLHTWSLSVEEQFYLFFPIVAVFTHKFFRKHFLTILVALSLLSLQFAEVMEGQNPDLNFYSPLSRFWELAIGSILAYRELNCKSTKGDLRSQVLPVLGLHLVAYSILFFDDKVSHPGFYTIVPVLGVALIIGFASKDELVGKILGSKPLVSVGLISYSAYLWHFPIFAFSRSPDSSNSDKFWWIALTLFLSIISYFLVERPFRRSEKITRKKLLVFLTVSVAISVGTMGYVMVSGGERGHFRLPLILSGNPSESVVNLYKQNGTSKTVSPVINELRTFAVNYQMAQILPFSFSEILTSRLCCSLFTVA